MGPKRHRHIQASDELWLCRHCLNVFGQFQRFLLIMPKTLLAFPEKDVMCLDHFRSSFNNTPRQEIHSTGSSSIPQKIYFPCGGNFLVEIHIFCIVSGWIPFAIYFATLLVVVGHPAVGHRPPHLRWHCMPMHRQQKNLIEDVRLSATSFT